MMTAANYEIEVAMRSAIDAVSDRPVINWPNEPWVADLPRIEAEFLWLENEELISHQIYRLNVKLYICTEMEIGNLSSVLIVQNLVDQIPRRVVTSSGLIVKQRSEPAMGQGYSDTTSWRVPLGIRTETLVKGA